MLPNESIFLGKSKYEQRIAVFLDFTNTHVKNL